jgi:hypothetical protein
MVLITLPEYPVLVINARLPLHAVSMVLLYLGNMTHEDEHTHEKLVKTSVYLEEEVLEALEEAARELEKDTNRKWSKGGVIRLALSDFFTRRGKLL